VFRRFIYLTYSFWRSIYGTFDWPTFASGSDPSTL